MFQDVIKEGNVKLSGSKKCIIAHRKENQIEYLNEHSKKTEIVFNYFLTVEGVYKNLFDLLNENYESKYNKEDFKKILLDLARFHDIGKINPKFQKEKIKNSDFKNYKIPKSIDLTSRHSGIGALLYSLYLMEKEVERDPFLLLLPYVIKGHHTRVRSIYESDLGIAEIIKRKRKEIAYIQEILPVDNEDLSKLLQEVVNVYGYHKLREKLKENASILSYFYNYIYSTLVRSDSIATNYAYNTIEDIKEELPNYNRRINQRLLNKIEEGYNRKQSEYEELRDKNPLNKYRSEMLKKACNSLEKGLNQENSVFYLQMPTGGGKTHTSIAISIKLLKETNASRIIYSLPYISLLEQNYEYFQNVTGLHEDELRSIYSLSDIPTEIGEDETEEILFYDDFFEYPIICTTMVSLFDSIVKFDKNKKYRFGALTNSIIILDEIQTLPVEYWPEFNYLLNELADKFNSYILIMSATIPSLEKLKHTRSMEPKFQKNCHYLLKNPEYYYEKFKRNKIRNEQFEEIKIEDENGVNELADSVLKKVLVGCKKGKNRGLVVVNTVKTSKKLYERLKTEVKKLDLPIECLLLNSTILSSRKKQIVNKIQGETKNQNILLVSTQTIEAGLDVSFDFVVRDIAPLESIEQVRGRCNRNKEKDIGDVYLTKNVNEKAEATQIYPGWRINETEKILEKTNFSYDHKDVREYFQNTVDTINKEISEDIKLTSADNIRCWNKIKYEENNSFKNKRRNVFHVDVIEENRSMYDFFVEISLEKELFTEKEIKFIEDKIGLKIKDKIEGSKIIKEYLDKIKEQKKGYTAKKILKKQFKSIISKFTISASLPMPKEEIKNALTKVGPYYKISEHLIGEEKHHLYSKTKGLNKEYFKEGTENRII